MQIVAERAALLVVDVQKGFDDPRWGRRNNPQMEDRIVALLNAWRINKRTIIHVKHMSTDPVSPLRPGQPGNDFKHRFCPKLGEFTVHKNVNSGFIGTALEALLRKRGHDTLVIVGMTTNHCISTTARMAANLGFTAWVVSDATSTFDRIGPDGVKYSAELVQAVALSDLHGEFADVVDTQTMLAATRKLPSAPSRQRKAESIFRL